MGRRVMLGLAAVPAALLLAACTPLEHAAGWFTAANVATLPVFGRGVVDLVYSAASGRDCSIVRLEQRRPYCAPPEAPPELPPFCTRSLAWVDCWAQPERLPGDPAQVAQAPEPTPAQLRDRAHRWPDL